MGRVSRYVWLVLGIPAILAGLWLAQEPLLAVLNRGEDIRAWVQGSGSLAPVAYITLFVGQILLPVPSPFVSLMGGYLFGAARGSLYTLIGLGIGAGLAASVARRLGRPVLRYLWEEQQLREWERRFKGHSPVTWCLLFLLPVPDAAYYVAGLSRVPLRWLLLAALVGRGPRLVMDNWLGAQAAVMPPQLALGMLALLAAAVFVAYRYQRRLRLLALLALRRARRLGRRLRSRSRVTLETRAEQAEPHHGQLEQEKHAENCSWLA